MARRPREEEEDPTLESPEAKRRRFDAILAFADDPGAPGGIHGEIWINEVLNHVDSAVDLVRLKHAHPVFAAEFFRLMSALYDRHFVSRFTGRPFLIAAVVKERSLSRTQIRPERRIWEAYSYMSEMCRMTLVATLASNTRPVAFFSKLLGPGTNSVMLPRSDIPEERHFFVGVPPRFVWGWLHDITPTAGVHFYDAEPFDDHRDLVLPGRDWTEDEKEWAVIRIDFVVQVKRGVMADCAHGRVVTDDPTLQRRREGRGFFFLDDFDPEPVWRSSALGEFAFPVQALVGAGFDRAERIEIDIHSFYRTQQLPSDYVLYTTPPTLSL